MIYKFRAYNKENKTMIILDPYQHSLCVLQEEDNWKVMMWTGLKDRHGREIYEGDIIKHNENIYIIVFDIHQQFCATGTVKCKSGRPNWRDYEWVYRLNKHIIVIGNIYENPELVKP